LGYNILVTGEITIDPPIPWPQIKDSLFLPDRAWQAGRDVTFRISTQERETNEGTLVIRHAVALIPSSEGQFKAYHLLEHIQQVIDTHPGHDFTGRLNCAGEEPGDLFRIEVHGRRATRVEPRIVWPDSSEGVGR